MNIRGLNRERGRTAVTGSCFNATNVDIEINPAGARGTKMKNEALLVELDCKVLVAVFQLNRRDGQRRHADAVCKHRRAEAKQVESVISSLPMI